LERLRAFFAYRCGWAAAVEFAVAFYMDDLSTIFIESGGKLIHFEDSRAACICGFQARGACKERFDGK
jgi:hypothetical protein